MDMDLLVRLGADELKMKMTMRIEARADVKGVDAKGDLALVEKITRMKMKIEGPQTVEIDTDKPGNDDTPEFKALAALVNVNIPTRMSPVGKLLETDLEPLRLAIRKANNAAFEKSIEDSFAKMFEGTFVQLSQAPVKTGDTYKAGTIVEDKVKIHVSYKIGPVSADKNKVIMEPTGVLELAPGAFPEGVDAKIKSQRLVGWVLFDRQAGLPTDHEVRFRVVLEIAAMGQTGTVEVTARSRGKAGVK
jgi:hypothetical protein